MTRKNAELPAALARIAELAAGQEGVCTTAQARACGVPDDTIDRMVRAGRWVRIHRGVHLTHPGRPSFLARMWAAHLATGPRSVITGLAATRYWRLVDDDAVAMAVLLPEGSQRRARGVAVHRVPDPSARAHPARRPPVVTVEHAVLDMLSAARSDAQAIEWVLRSCRLRLTTPDRLLATAAQRPRLRRRRLLALMCAEILAGVTTGLEHVYLVRVERAHGLPTGRRQAVAGRPERRQYRDVLYEEWGIIVELDGRLGHEEESAVLRDQVRDNAAVLLGLLTLRFGWLGVGGDPCDVASQLVALLRRRGWQGAFRRCGPGCTVAEPVHRAA